jgi:UDP-2,3-diacylglucosamine pyrophosphatase LpxH
MTSLAVFLCLSLAQAAPAPPARSVVVISDLHFGPGRDGDARWDRYEDFRWADDLAAFLTSLHEVAQGPVDLVLAGDAFELWQARDGACPERDDRDLGCTEAESVKRLERAIADHRPELQALQEFATRRGNRLVILPGNHDAALLFPEVTKTLLAAVPAASVPATGYWLSDDGGVLVEHGHMIGADPNRLEGWPEPFRTSSSVRHLRRPWGEQFVTRFYDAWEDRFPLVDNLTEEYAGAKLAMEAIGVPKTLAATKDFLRFFFFDVSLRQFRGALGNEDGQPPTWDLDALRRGGDAVLANALPPEDPMAAMLRQGAFTAALREAGVPSVVAAFDDIQLKEICDKEFVNRVVRRKAGENVPSAPCPVKGALGADGDLGAIAQKLLGLQDKALADRLRKLREVTGRSFSTYVYGHTHGAHEARQAIRRGGWKPVAVNDGAWQRVVTPAQVAAYRTRPDGTLVAAREVLEAPLETLPACYTYVLVPAGRSDAPRLRSWRLRDGGWGHGEGAECAGLPMTAPPP